MLRLSEHNQYYHRQSYNAKLREIYGDLSTIMEGSPKTICFENKTQRKCLSIVSNDAVNIHIETSYYVGLDWLPGTDTPVWVEPKMNTAEQEIDLLKMLSEALTEPANFEHLSGLMKIKFHEKWIPCKQDNNVLSPFLMLQFLMVVKSIIRKGLKKDYRTIRKNLRSSLKGKVLIAQQMKHNLSKHNPTNTYCAYSTYDADHAQNQFLKHVLQQLGTHISSYKDPKLKQQLQGLLRYAMGAFTNVRACAHHRIEKETNPFYSAYNQAVHLGRQLLKLQGGQVTKNSANSTFLPPHWIDMSKLFELYVFQQLRLRYPEPGAVKYHVKAHYQELDFLLDTPHIKCVIDAKYKPRYKSGNPTKSDCRQIAGYARLKAIYKALRQPEDAVIPVYIIYPKLHVEGDPHMPESDMEEKFGESYQPVKPAPLCVTSRASTAYNQLYLQEVVLPCITAAN